ncbi:MAG: glycine--tRNA ligase subunit beta [Burkholderiaceae bacterium]
MHAPLLIELLTEELPPKALRRLADAFAQSLQEGLTLHGLLPAGAPREVFATPRRLAVCFDQVAAQGDDRPIALKGPSVSVGLDAQGEPTLALRKWAEKQGARIEQLVREGDGKQESFWFRSLAPGVALQSVLGTLLTDTLARLPIPKLMQYQLADGKTSVHFVRPAHGLVVLHGEQVIDTEVLGIRSGRITRGHRFQGEASLSVDHARDYDRLLTERGHVIASFERRKALIADQLQAQARRLGASLGEDTGIVEALLDEVTALVEWPAVYVGGFEAEFLKVPQECLILTMRTNQKYFPLFDATGALLARFLIVSNMAIDDPSLIIDGNERVVRPRLADARFFFEQDQRQSLESRIQALASVVYHARLGTQAQRTERVRSIGRALAAHAGASADAVDRAALLAKTDLLTGMVGEFPELQGSMGRHYALHDGEAPEVAQAIAEHYQPRFAGDALPASPVGLALALADKLETLAGIWGIGAHPTGDRDPFALRRHALGVLRMLIERPSASGAPVHLQELIETAFSAFSGLDAVKADIKGLSGFFTERLRGYLRDQGHAAEDIDAVLAVDADRLDRIESRLKALPRFRALPEAGALAAANKRIGNILRKAFEAEGSGPQATSVPTRPAQPDADRLIEPAEKALHQAMIQVAQITQPLLEAQDYAAALQALAALRGPVDAFFDEVMVNVQDPGLRANRIALLAALHGLMNRIADLSRLPQAVA